MEYTDKFQNLTFESMIKNARSKIKTYNINNESNKRIFGEGTDVSLVLLADKYNKTFNTTDETLENDLNETQVFDDVEKIPFYNIFEYYSLFLTSVANNSPDATKEIEYCGWIYISTIHALYTLDHLQKSNASKKSKPTKALPKERSEKIWRKHNLGTDEVAVKNLRLLYFEEYKEELTTGTRTIREKWIRDWIKNPR